MNQEIVLTYGHTTKTPRVPESNLAWVVGPKDAPPVANLADAVRAAIHAPIGAPSLRTHPHRKSVTRPARFC